MNKFIDSKKIESEIKNFPIKSLGRNGFTSELYQTFKEELTSILKLFQKIEKEGRLQTQSMRPALS